MGRRILLLTTDLRIGGTPTVVRELAVRLMKEKSERSGVRGSEEQSHNTEPRTLNPEPLNIDIEVACLATWGPVADQLQTAGVPVTALGAEAPTEVRVIGRLVELIRSGGFDTVFSFLIHANAAAAAASLRYGGVRFLQSIQTTQPRPRWHWWLQYLVQNAAEQIVVPSESVAQAARDRAAVPADKIVIIPNAVDPAEFEDPAGTPFRAGMHEGGDAPPYPIGFIGRLDPVKRVPDLLEATRLLGGQLHLHIFGDGPEGPSIRTEAARLGIAHLVTMHGTVTRPQEALRQIGLLVLPSEAEGFGLVLIEAMAAGVPVVATDAPGIRDVVRHGQTGLLVPVGSPAALAQAIRRLIEDHTLAGWLVDHAKSDVRERFSWPVVIGQYRRLLQIES